MQTCVFFQKKYIFKLAELIQKLILLMRSDLTAILLWCTVFTAPIFAEQPGVWPSPVADPPSVGGCGDVSVWQAAFAARQRTHSSLLIEGAASIVPGPDILSGAECRYVCGVYAEFGMYWF